VDIPKTAFEFFADLRPEQISDLLNRRCSARDHEAYPYCAFVELAGHLLYYGSLMNASLAGARALDSLYRAALAFDKRIAPADKAIELEVESASMQDKAEGTAKVLRGLPKAIVTEELLEMANRLENEFLGESEPAHLVSRERGVNRSDPIVGLPELAYVIDKSPLLKRHLLKKVPSDHFHKARSGSERLGRGAAVRVAARTQNHEEFTEEFRRAVEAVFEEAGIWPDRVPPGEDETGPADTEEQQP
jgi:hypothetical protein